MPRLIPATLQTRFDQVITQIFYLIQINADLVMRWSNGGSVDVSISAGGVVPWADLDFEVTGLKWEAGALISGRLRAANHGNELGSAFLNADMADVTIDIYQVDREVLDHPQYLGQLVFDDTTINPDYIDSRLISNQSAYAKGPRRRVDVYNGFKYALPRGSKIPWGTTTFILEPHRG
jgi:hypothetical protein